MNRYIGYFLCFLILFTTLTSVYADTAASDYEAKLRAQEDLELAELKVYQDQRKAVQSEKSSLERDIRLLDAEIKEAQQKIKVRTITIERLSHDIGSKSTKIDGLVGKIERSSESLASLLRKSAQNDSVSLPEVVLGANMFSDFFGEADAYQSVSGAINTMLDGVRNLKDQTETEKAGLEDRKTKEEDARKDIDTAKRLVEKNQKEKNVLLAVTKNKDNVYQNLIVDKERRIAKIRSALFQLRGGEGIAFGDAYDYAVKASVVTGVRPAFLLAILTQESSLGKNVGNCYLQNDDGSGVGVSTGTFFKNVMNPTRDIPVFKRITSDLGLSAYATKVSCPLSYGWGGAMGPAQFIPSTWQLFQKRVGNAVGTSIPNPWDAFHAFTASSIYLSDLGAGLQTYNAERNSACKYYSGASCGTRTGSTTYGNQVMKKAANIQECMIDPIIGKSNGC